jgi:hypothetical protein
VQRPPRPPLPPVAVLLGGLFGAALVWLVGLVQERSVDRTPGWLALGVFVGCLIAARWRVQRRYRRRRPSARTHTPPWTSGRGR